MSCTAIDSLNIDYYVLFSVLFHFFHSCQKGPYNYRLCDDHQKNLGFTAQTAQDPYLSTQIIHFIKNYLSHPEIN